MYSPNVACLLFVLCGAGDFPPLDEAAAGEAPITEEDREHWAFRPLERPEVPPVASGERVENPVDRFIQARIEEAGLEPLPPADRITLIRRLTFDLTGLPPSPGEIDAFLGDASPGAYERLVDRLLASPSYGERWGQHWLDLARFAESDGFEFDATRPNAWRYRDWVIAALNADAGYDEFVRLQIAGDELRPDDPGAVVATGFALCGPDMPDINSQDERRHMVLNDAASTLGAVFLGLQTGCAQCHDHKWDPVSQADFYRLRAFYENVVIFKDHPLPGAEGKDAPKGRVLRETDAKIEPSYLRVRGVFDRPGARVTPAYPRIANPWKERVAPVPPGGETSGLRSQLARHLTRPDHPLVPRVIVNRIWQHHFGRGLVESPSDFGTRGGRPSHPALLDWLATEIPRRGWSLKELHRLIVTSAAYRRASRPAADGETTPAERERVERVWKDILGRDPGNRLLARRERRRLEAEAVRDALLAAAGRLSLRRGGPGVMPPLPPEVRKAIRKNHWKASPDEEDHHRRSIYLFVRRNLRFPFLEVFDRPDTSTSCARRSVTTTAPQSLALLNSELSLDTARALAGRVLTETRAEDGDAERITLAYRLALGRRPAPPELESAKRFLDSLAGRLRAEGREREALALPGPFPAHLDPHRGAAWTSFALALLNTNEFLYVD